MSDVADPFSARHRCRGRRGERRWRRYRSVAAGVLCALTSVLPLSAAERLEALTESWYSVEAIIFQRVEATPANSPEHLYHADPRGVPAGFQSFATDAPGSTYSLNPLTAATLEFPTLSFDCSGTRDASDQQPAGTPAWYQPPLHEDGPLSPPAPGAMTPEPGSEDPYAAPPRSTVLEDADASGQAANESTVPQLSGFPYDACRPTGPEIADSNDPHPNTGTVTAFGPETLAEELCPPVSFDIAVAPTQSRALCSLPPGQPPPAIEPVLEPHPLLDWLNAVRRFENRLRGDSYRAVMAGTTLRRQANRIRNSGQLRLLWHGRWTQQVPPRNAPEPLLIQAGRRDDGVHELEGTVAITLGRYLHFRARLWWVSLPTAREVRAAAPSSITGGQESGADPQPPGGIEYMVLEESRAMRSGTLHYLDHPVLGVLVRADPVTAPRWLVDASAVFESEQGGN